MGDDRYSFLVVEESLPTETIAEYRQARARSRSRGREKRDTILARLRVSLRARRADRL